MGFPTAPFPSRLVGENGDAAPKHHARGERPHAAQPVVQTAQTDVALPALPPGVDWDFVRRRENKNLKPETMGYVPYDPQGNSGVTIASGLDLGQHNEEDLKRIGIPDRLVNKMKPFLRLQGEAAKKEANRLTISEAEAAEIDRYLFAHTYRETARRFNEAAASGLSFEDLPIEAQTVIVSVSHQYGNNLAENAPKFWSHVTNGRWADADAELRDFGDSDAPRRKAEAELLAKAINAGALPNSGRPEAR